MATYPQGTVRRKRMTDRHAEKELDRHRISCSTLGDLIKRISIYLCTWYMSNIFAVSLALKQFRSGNSSNSNPKA